MKIVVKYKLNIFKNIMLLENWTNLIENTVVVVAFESLNKKSNLNEHLNVIKKCIEKNPRVLNEIVKSDPSGENKIGQL